MHIRTLVVAVAALFASTLAVAADAVPAGASGAAKAVAPSVAVTPSPKAQPVPAATPAASRTSTGTVKVTSSGSQQNRMRECNKQATGKKGAERKAFMKSCLSTRKNRT